MRVARRKKRRAAEEQSERDNAVRDVRADFKYQFDREMGQKGQELNKGGGNAGCTRAEGWERGKHPKRRR